MTRWHDWNRLGDIGIAVLEADGIVYQVRWVPNTAADHLVNDNTSPLPAPGLHSQVPLDAPGVLIDGDKIVPLNDEAVNALREAWLTGHENVLEEHQSRLAAAAVIAAASNEFLSLRDVRNEVGKDWFKYYLKPPKSELEIRHLQLFRGQPGIVQLVGRMGNMLVLQNAGMSLSEWAFDGHAKDIDPRWPRKWVLDIARAVGAMHCKGITHRDLSFNNIVVRGEIATVIDLECGMTTSGYLAPEATHEGFDYDTRADVFSFGMLLWSIENKNMPRPFMSTILKCTGPFADVMRRCVDIKPASRPSMGRAVTDIEAVWRTII